MKNLFTPQTRLRLAWFSFGSHLCAVIVMLLVQIHGLPPGELSLRREFVALNALWWGVGWVIWMITALSLILFYLAWIDVIVHKGWGLLAVGLAFAGGLVDWVNETIWIFLAPMWAIRAEADPFYASIYALWDQLFLALSSGLANLLYTLGGLTLTLVAFRTHNFPKWLAWWGLIIWIFSLALSVAAFMGEATWMIMASSVVFSLFLPWLVLIGYGWLVGVNPSNIEHDVSERLSFSGVMRAMAPKHPVPMKTVFRECFLVNFAVDAQVMRRALPGPIEPDLYQGRAFLSVVIAKMERMRPAFLPEIFGVSYNQVVYRAVVRCQGERGVYFLRSDADNWLMSLAGDWLTFFRFNRSRISFRHQGQQVYFDVQAHRSQPADIHATFDGGHASKEMPPSSKFKTLAEAQEFLVELFTAFGYDPLTDQVSTVRIERGEWQITIIEDIHAHYEFMQGGKFFPLPSACLDSVFYVENLPYYWYRLTRT